MCLAPLRSINERYQIVKIECHIYWDEVEFEHITESNTYPYN